MGTVCLAAEYVEVLGGAGHVDDRPVGRLRLPALADLGRVDVLVVVAHLQEALEARRAVLGPLVRRVGLGLGLGLGLGQG